MGEVYRARDTRLGREVAIKVLPAEVASSPDRLARFEREARTVARLNHPNIVTLHSVEDSEGVRFLTMELLEGEPLSTRLERGPLALPELSPIALGVLAALEALHRQEIVHRDLKPSNIFLTPHGAKLLDFGLAHPIALDSAAGGDTLTRTDLVAGTPRYMAPEQWNVEAVGPTTDLFSLGALLYESLTGTPSFAGNTAAEVRHATLFDQPPALAGPAAIARIDRLLRRAMAKRPNDRFPSAAAMAAELRQALVAAGGADVGRIRAVTRLAVLPFRMLRPDPDTEFLCLSLADAITSSLTGFESLIVRSAWAVARFDADAPDFRAIAAEADVDLVLIGSLLRGGNELRASAQLIEVPAGTAQWSRTIQAPLDDVFALQDRLAREIVVSLSLPLAGRERGALQRDVPASARAYELYLRANQAARSSIASESWTVARDLYLEALREDPRYAPAWAQLGRVYRLLAKYHDDGASENSLQADDAFRRSLELNPELNLAHNLQANFEVERGRAHEILARLLRRAWTQRTDTELFGALVHACRYAGLLEASVAADTEARRLDPNARTSVAFTHWMRGAYEETITGPDSPERTGTFAHRRPVSTSLSLSMLGREEEALAVLRRAEAETPSGSMRALLLAVRAALEGDRDGVTAGTRHVLTSSFRDPEGFYFVARGAARVGLTDLAVDVLRRVVDGGFFCALTMASDPWLDALRDDRRFQEIHQRAEAARRRAAQIFLEAEGDKLLGTASL
jgi:TolB-like protein